MPYVIDPVFSTTLPLYIDYSTISLPRLYRTSTKLKTLEHENLMYDSDVYQREDVGLASRIHYLQYLHTVQCTIPTVYGTADTTAISFVGTYWSHPTCESRAYVYQFL